MILLDTHVLVWCSLDPARLGPKATAAIGRAWSAAELFASAISFWEVALLVQRDRLQLDIPVAAWRHQWLSQGLQEQPLDGALAVAGAELTVLHSDPADRWIAAGALAAQATLITADAQLLAWGSQLPRLDARQ